MIALVTDSSSLLPDRLAQRFAVRVVPLTIVVDGHPYADGTELSTGECYERLAAGATVTTAAPPPGAFLAVYEDAARRGADAVLSVHVGSNTSATVASARLGAASSPVPVEVVDTGTASYPVACCVWGAAAALARGATLLDAADAARAVADTVGNVFVAGALDLARRGGRLDADVAGTDGVPVLALRDGKMHAVASVHDVEAAVDAMVEEFAGHAAGRRMRVGVGDAAADDLAVALSARLDGRPDVASLLRYDVGPSVVAHTGLGTAGAVYFPAELAG